jgi:hypothetical protein
MIGPGVFPPLPQAKPFVPFPNLQDWKKASCVGTAIGPPLRKNDPGLVRIDDLVAAYNQANNAGAKAGEKQYLLGELFFATLHWNNNYKTDRRMDAGRRTAIMSLNLTVANVLSAAFQCGLGELPARLNNLFGKALSVHGVTVDANSTRFYLDAAKREQWRVGFRGGKAYKFETLNTDPKAPPVLLNTQAYVDDKEQRQGDCGYALSMSDELYVGPLLGKEKSGVAVRDAKPVFHSSFMGGRPVQCAGMITVKDGIVTQLSGDSGHYQPVDTDMVKVLQLLKSTGMPLKQIEVRGYNKEKKTVEVVWFNGDEFLQKNGNWEILRKTACQPLWNDYNSKKYTLRELVTQRYDAFKLPYGKNRGDQELWKMAYESVCWDLAVFDPKWNEEAKKPPIPRTAHPSRVT